MSNESANHDHLTDCGNAHLTSKDFVQCREALSGIVVAPFDPSKAKGVGYNFSLSEMIYSVTQKRLVPICRDAHETYFYLQPHDTILALSYEYLKVDDYIAGDFHSRVRMSALGVGSTSTTLDPGWKGMLLFSLNNPTKKKIKILLSTRADGVVRQHPVLTLVSWRIVKPTAESDADGSNEYLSLHLDNPPMRIDIWSELAAKPLRLFRNREYQQFAKLVESLSPFKANPSQHVSWAEPLRTMLTDLSVAIEAQKDETAIRTALIQIQSVEEIPESMNKRLKCLTACMDTNSEDSDNKNLLTYCSQSHYQKMLELANREIQYLVLCDQIEQIHDMISKQVPTSWRKNVLANIWHHFMRNIGILLATIYFVFLLSFGQTVVNSEYWMQLALAFVPYIVSVIYHITVEKK